MRVHTSLQWDYEKLLTKQYAEKLEREEQARANEFKARLDALNRISGNYQSQVGARLQQEKVNILCSLFTLFLQKGFLNQELNEHRTMQEVQKRVQEDEERERRKAETRKKEILRSFEFNTQLVDNKRQEKEQQRREEVQARLRLEQSVAEQEAKVCIIVSIKTILRL